MKTNQTLENINNSVQSGFSGVFNVVSKKDIFFSWVFIISILISGFISILMIVEEFDFKNYIEFSTKLILSFLPSILGFTVSGYAIIIGFSQSSLLNKFTEKLSKSKYSLYQKISGSFAINILFQAITLILACLINLIISFDDKKPNLFSLSCNWIKIMNEVGVFLISFGLVISLLVVLQIVLNVFSFSQLIHYQTNFDKINENKENNTES